MCGDGGAFRIVDEVNVVDAGGLGILLVGHHTTYICGMSFVELGFSLVDLNGFGHILSGLIIGSRFR